MNCVVINQDRQELLKLKFYCQETSFLNFKGGYDTFSEAIQFIESGQVNLVLISGGLIVEKDFKRLQKVKHQPMVIITSVNPVSPPNTYLLHAVDQLFYNTTFQSFKAKTLKARDLCEQRKSVGTVPNVFPSMGFGDEISQYIYIPATRDIARIRKTEITHILYIRNRISVYLCSCNNPIHTTISLELLFEKLGDTNFFRVHENFIVNLAFVENIVSDKIIINKLSIPLGTPYKQALINRIGA